MASRHPSSPSCKYARTALHKLVAPQILTVSVFETPKVQSTTCSDQTHVALDLTFVRCNLHRGCSHHQSSLIFGAGKFTLIIGSFGLVDAQLPPEHRRSTSNIPCYPIPNGICLSAIKCHRCGHTVIAWLSASKSRTVTNPNCFHDVLVQTV